MYRRKGKQQRSFASDEARQSWRDRAGVKQGEAVLVTGASGGMGTSVAKIAKSGGARVIGVDRKVLQASKAAEYDLIHFYHRQLTLYGVDTRALDTVASGAILENLRPSFEAGLLSAPYIARTCGLEDAMEAYREVDSGKVDGKIVTVFQ